MLDSQMAQGFMIAIFFAMFMGGAMYIFEASYFLWGHSVAAIIMVGR
jgi:hypothetical protein